LVVGESVDARDTAKAVPATLVFISGFAIVFAGLGIAAGQLGSSLTTLQDALERVGGAIVLVLGLMLLGVLRAPRERRLVTALPVGRARPFVLGVAFGAAWSPCVGPLLGAALVVAARGGEPLRGALLLLAYAAGIGVPFLLASLGLAASPGIASSVRRIGPALERVGGVLLVALGLLLATGTYAHFTSYLARFAPAAGGL
jgi:cytochrome c-type biogenesis protein